LLVRICNLHSPLLEVHQNRQTDTAFPVFYYLQHGIDLLHPMVPGFGPPWVYPVEFPIFQATATILIRVTGMDIDAGCRLTNIIYFYLSAGMLYLLAGRFFQRRSTAVCIAMFYLWSPFSVVWSRTCMIEFCAATFGLAYVYFTSLWLARPRKPLFLLIAIAVGCLGALAKITSMLPVVPLLLCLPAAAIWDDMRQNDPTLRPTAVKQMVRGLLAQWVTIALSMALYVIPVLVGQVWTSYADRIKQASLPTRYLASANMNWWVYGTLDERLTPGWWRIICFRLGLFVTPFAAMALPVVALIVVRRAPTAARMALYAALAGVILTISTFFNLYHEHDYYLCAVFPMIALVAGYGLDYVVRMWVMTDWRTAVPVIAAAALSWFAAYDYVSPSFTIGYDNAICQTGKAIDEVTGPNECVVVADWGGSPSILYYAKRRGYSALEDDNKSGQPDMHSLAFLRDDDFTTLVCQRNHPWFNIWPGLTMIRQVGPFAIVRIKHE
jgi:hypothetical protein